MSSALVRLASRIAALEDQLRSRAAAPQLASSSVEDGALEVNETTATGAPDEDGGQDVSSAPRALLGLQHDGTWTSSSLGGPVPPRPAAPILEPAPGGLVVRVSGLFAGADSEPDVTITAPMDFARWEIHASTGAIEGTEATLRATIDSPRGGEVFLSLPPSPQNVGVFTRSESGQLSALSPVATETPLAIADAAEFDAMRSELDAAEGRLDSAEADLSTSTGRIDNLTNNVIPGVASDAQAAADAAEADAIAAAAADAAAKADAAQQAAIDAAAADATAKAEQAEADATAAAAATAQAKADAAQQAAIDAAAATAQLKADGAKQAAIDAAEADAASKAAAAKQAAIDAAAADATAKANAAESAAAATATADATAKANDARADAIAASAPRIVRGGPGGGTTYYNVLSWSGGTRDTEGNVVITTPITAQQNMTTVHIRGYSYSTPQTDINLTVGFYAYTNAAAGTVSFPNTGFTNAGSCPISARLAYAPDGTVAIILTSERADGLWQYPVLAISDVTVRGGSDAFVSGWSADFVLEADLTTTAGLTGIVSPPAYDAGAMAEAAQSTADDARSLAITADGRVTASTAAPVSADAAGKPEGALWYRYTGDALVGAWRLVSGAWVSAPLDRTFIPAIDIGTGTFGDLDGGRLKANSVVTEALAAGAVDADKVNAQSVAAVTSQFIAADIGKLTVTGTANISDAVAERITAQTGKFIQVSTDNLAAGAVTADKLSIGANSQSYLTNGNFEDWQGDRYSLPAGWGLWDPGTLAVWRTEGIDSGSISGDYTVRLEKLAATGVMSRFACQDHYPVAGGDVLALRGKYRAGAGIRVSFFAYWYDGTRTFLSSTYASDSTNSGSGKVEEIAAQLTVPDNAAFVRVGVRHHNDNPTGSYIWVDNLQCTKAVAPVQIEDGAITASKITADALNGKTITGATIQTASSGTRWLMRSTESNYLRGFAGVAGEYNSGGLYMDGLANVRAQTTLFSPRMSSNSGNIAILSLVSYDGGGNSATLQGNTATLLGGNSQLAVSSGRVESTAIYNAGNSASPNVLVGPGGHLQRSTSLAKSKVAINRAWGDAAPLEAIKALRPTSYYDRGNAERYAALVDEVPPGFVGPLPQGAAYTEYPRELLGLIAEDVDALGLHTLATYDDVGDLNGVAYDRLAVHLLPWLHEIDSRLSRIESTLSMTADVTASPESAS